jgi:hypothetical protein
MHIYLSLSTESKKKLNKEKKERRIPYGWQICQTLRLEVCKQQCRSVLSAGDLKPRSFRVQKDEILTYSVANSVEILVSLATDVDTGFREEKGTLADEDNALVS